MYHLLEAPATDEKEDEIEEGNPNIDTILKNLKYNQAISSTHNQKALHKLEHLLFSQKRLRQTNEKILSTAHNKINHKLLLGGEENDHESM